MKYQIQYGLSGDVKRMSLGNLWLFRILIGLLVVSTAVAAIWSLGGDWLVTIEALEAMAENLGQGSDLREAFSGFCTEILQGV